MRKVIPPCVSVALCLFGIVQSPLVIAQNQPTGSYSQSCSDIKVTNNTLTASCRKLDGGYNKTSLTKLDNCLNSISMYGDIGNIDGNLICIPDIPKPDPGFTFPQSETTLNSWVYGGQLDSIYKHGWGIWAGLTQFVGSIGATPVRAFETWATTSNMLYRMEHEPAKGLKALAVPQQRSSRYTLPACG